MTIMYLTFGEKTEYHVQAFLSMLSFRAQMSDGDRLVMVTTAPQMYGFAQSWAEIIAITDEQVELWKGPHRFFWRAKIKAIEMVGNRYGDDDLLYLDCDTVLRGNICWLKEQLQQGHGLMDTNDGHPSRMKTKTLRMWKTVKGRTYGGITLDSRHNMFCAGVVGIPHARRQETVATALALCDGMLADGAERIVIEQYALSVALFEKTSLMEAKDCIAHYWAAKDEWMAAAQELMCRVLLTGASEEETIRLFKRWPWAQLPVYVHKSSTARRLRKLIARWWPDRDKRYFMD